MEKINVLLIRAFDGPRHRRLEKIWEEYAAKNVNRMNLHVLENRREGLGREGVGPLLQPCDAMALEWRQERWRPERYAIFTEFDFLPGEGFLAPPPGDRPFTCAEFVTRDVGTCKIVRHKVPSMWFLLVDKERLGGAEPNFTPGGPKNDVCGRLKLALCELLPTTDCYPTHYGVQVADRGVHLFWSRHYNDPPDLRPAGFPLGDILRKIDRALDSYTFPAACR